MGCSYSYALKCQVYGFHVVVLTWCTEHWRIPVAFRIWRPKRNSTGQGWRIKEARRLMAGDIHAHNSFDEPRRVWPEDIGLEGESERGIFLLPPQSITTLRAEVVSDSVGIG